MTFAFYFAYKALTNSWIFLTFKPDAVFSSVLSDTSTTANSDHVTEIQKSKKASCPILELINALKNILIKLVFAVLKDVFPKHREMLDKLSEVIMMMTNLDTKDIITLPLRIFILLPAIAFCILHIILSFVSAFVKPFTRLHILVIIFPLFSIFLIFMAIPQFLAIIFENLPFFNFVVEIGDGYRYANSVYTILMLVIIATFVDFFLQPIYPLSKDDYYSKEYINIHDAEVFNPIAVMT